MAEGEVLCRVQALYSFKSNDPSSLSFTQNDVIDVLHKLPSGWWDGLCNGTRGWFPSNYVKVISNNNLENVDKNKDYRLSLAYNPKTALNSNESLILENEQWLPENTSDICYLGSLDMSTKLSLVDKNDLLPIFNDDDDDDSTTDWSVIDEKTYWLNRATSIHSQQRKYSSSDSQSTISKSDTNSLSLSRQTSIRNTVDEPLTWNKMYNTIAVVIYQLIAAAKSNQNNLIQKYAVDIVNSIRFMLVTSSAIDKDNTWMKGNTSLRSHHRVMMANMSKLALSAQTSPSLFMTDEQQQISHTKILTESNELLLSVRNFINACQSLKVPLTQAVPQLLDQPSESTVSSKTPHRYSLQINLAENLETMGTCIQELAETMVKCITDTSDSLVLSTHFKNLSSQTSLFLIYLDETDFTQVQQEPEYFSLQSAKQQLIQQLGTLFLKLQGFASSSTLLDDVSSTTQALLPPIRSICSSVAQLAKGLPQPPSSPTSTVDESGQKPTEVKQSLTEDTSERPLYLSYDYGDDDLVFSKDGSVRGGTLSALVERLTLHDYLDMNYISNFLLTYRSFCSSEQLLDLLETRYNLSCPEGLSPQEKAVWEEKKLKLVRLRVFNVLKNWLDAYYNEDDSVVLDRLLVFTHTCIRRTLKFSNGQLEALIERRRNAVENGGLKKMILTLPAPPEPILPKNKRMFRLLDLEPLEMARQLTIMDFKLYSAIRPIECLDKAWSNEDSNVAVNIRSSIEYCNQVTSWVSDVILSQRDIKKRSILIKYWVQVAEKLLLLNNFNTCMAVVSAFDNSSVGRLKRTWELVGTRTNQTLQHIRKIMGANRNFVEYRDMIHSVNPPCIPFLGIYLQDLTFIEDGNSNTLKLNKVLINFAKRAKTAEVIREIQQFQSSLYQLKPVKEIQDFIRSNLKSTRDEEQLYKESLKLEPREREDEKITRLLQESGFL